MSDIFHFEEDHLSADPMLQGELAAAIAAANAAQWEKLILHEETLSLDTNGPVPDASLLPFTRVHELIRTQQQQQQFTTAQPAKPAAGEAPLHKNYFSVEADDLCMAICYYALVVASLFLILSLLFHR